MQKKILILPLAALFLFAFAQSRYIGKMDAFKWMIGTWKSQTKDGTIMETWRPMTDTSYDGETTLYKKTTETVMLEKIRLVSRGNNFYYIPAVQGQNNNKSVEFRITKYDKKGFIAENPSHDFPNKITYSIKKDSLFASVEGKGKREEYKYVRVKAK